MYSVSACYVRTGIGVIRGVNFDVIVFVYQTDVSVSTVSLCDSRSCKRLVRGKFTVDEEGGTSICITKLWKTCKGQREPEIVGQVSCLNGQILPGRVGPTLSLRLSSRSRVSEHSPRPYKPEKDTPSSTSDSPLSHFVFTRHSY